MSRLRALLRASWRWATDWRTGAVLVATAVVAYFIVSYIANYDTAQDALAARDQTGAAATRRIDRLTADNDEQDDRIEQLEREGGRRDAALQVLMEQLRREGVDPILVTVTTPAPTTTTSAPPAPSTTTTTQPAPPEEEPTPDEGDGLCFGPIRIGDCP